jgi:chaperonin GroEL
MSICTISSQRASTRPNFLDDIRATKAAVAEGIVPGGELALLRCVDSVADEERKCQGDKKTGVQIIRRTLEAPTRQIAENYAIDDGS